ncbi:hypothetical protein K470DRAFT_1722 [Piedraia hortae CBS 480.64]|uniref:FAR1 domain-containing protein n=1 Tax=Piedraia hortae CBS 480.64 TaxID=1314780 RepID=A0A6A7C9Y8_9PEZI|nr:hypothetical protein K470DRAFT_1722 [Piedraia hortae CBS 480.64]
MNIEAPQQQQQPQLQQQHHPPPQQPPPPPQDAPQSAASTPATPNGNANGSNSGPDGENHTPIAKPVMQDFPSLDTALAYINAFSLEHGFEMVKYGGKSMNKNNEVYRMPLVCARFGKPKQHSQAGYPYPTASSSQTPGAAGTPGQPPQRKRKSTKKCNCKFSLNLCARDQNNPSTSAWTFTFGKTDEHNHSGAKDVSSLANHRRLARGDRHVGEFLRSCRAGGVDAKRARQLAIDRFCGPGSLVMPRDVYNEWAKILSLEATPGGDISHSQPVRCHCRTGCSHGKCSCAQAGVGCSRVCHSGGGCERYDASEQEDITAMEEEEEQGPLERIEGMFNTLQEMQQRTAEEFKLRLQNLTQEYEDQNARQTELMDSLRDEVLQFLRDDQNQQHQQQQQQQQGLHSIPGSFNHSHPPPGNGLIVDYEINGIL